MNNQEETKLMQELRGNYRESFVLSCLRGGERMGLSENETLKRVIIALCDCNDKIYREELDRVMNRTTPQSVVINKSFYEDGNE